MSSSEDETKEAKESGVAGRKEEKQASCVEEELRQFENLCISPTGKLGHVEAMCHDLTTTLRCELAALEYKRDRLVSELQESKNMLRCREQRVSELQVEADQVRELAARQNAAVSSLKKRVQELEERERQLYATQGRNEIAMQGMQRDAKYREEKLREYEERIRQLEQTASEEREARERARANLQEFARKLGNVLSAEYRETMHLSPEMLVQKVEESMQETSRLRARTSNAETRLASVEVDFRSCRDALDRTVTEKEQLQRQLSAQSIELDRLKQEKECLEMQQRVLERELTDTREKLVNAGRNISSAAENASSREALIAQLRDDLKHREERAQRVQSEARHFLESLAALVGGPNGFVEAHEKAIKDRVREIVAENKDQALCVRSLREKVNVAAESTDRQNELLENTVTKIRTLENERSDLEVKVCKLESELSSCELSKESLRRDKEKLESFLERLCRTMQMDEMPADSGLEFRTESALIRAEQLARLEMGKLTDKSRYQRSRSSYAILPKIRRERSFHELSSMKETSVVYQLQRRVRTLREQLQRRDLHLDLLRRKLSLQEDNVRAKSLLQNERDEANVRAKKLSKQIDRLQLQLSEERSRNRELSAQLTEAADYKIAALERSRKIEELQKRLIESEMTRTRCNRKLTMLKEQLRSTTETAEQERSINHHSLQLLRDELAQVKQNLSDITKRECQLQSFRVSVAKLLSEPLCIADYEIIGRLQKIVAAHRDFTMLSRRYDETLDTSPSRCPSGMHPMHPPRSPGSRCTRYEDSGYADPPDIRDVEDELNKRPLRSGLVP